MPVPIRYIPIRDVLQDGIAQALDRGAEALRAGRGALEMSSVTFIVSLSVI